MATLQSSNHPAKRQAGFSLVEVLISVLVVAFGLLAIAALNVKVLQANHIAYQRGIASDLARELSERMRANSGDRLYMADDERYALAPVAACYLAASGSNSFGGLDCPAGDQRAIARQDLADIRAAAATVLPAATVSLSLRLGANDAASGTQLSQCSYELSASSTPTTCLINIDFAWRERPESAQLSTFRYAVR